MPAMIFRAESLRESLSKPLYICGEYDISDVRKALMRNKI